MIVKLVRVTGRPHLGGVQGEPGPAQFLGLIPVVDTGEPDQQPTRVPAHRFHDEGPGRGRVGGHHAAHGEPQVWVIGAYFHRDLAADPVRPRDPADHQLHDGLANLVHVQQIDPDVLAAGQ